jgi:hypothetical protein
MSKLAEVKIVFASGHVETFDIDLEKTDDLSTEALEDGIITLAKMHGGHGAGEKTVDTIWALMGRSPLAAYCVNSKNVDFVSVRVK